MQNNAAGNKGHLPAIRPTPIVQRKCNECEEEEVQRKESDPASIPDTSSVDQVLSSAGHPLTPETRDFFESRFGTDFSTVRVHTDAGAERSAEEMGARAYSVGQNIVFGSGQFVPETHDGKHLLAHELTHVVQQSAGVPTSLQRAPDEQADTDDSDHGEDEEGDEDEPIDDYESGANNEVSPDEDDDDIETDPDQPLDDKTVSLKPIKPPTKGKWILVKLPKTLTRYEGSKKISSWGVSAGRPKHPTPTGSSFQINYRDENHTSNSYGKCNGSPIGPDGLKKCKKKGGKYAGADMHYFQRFAPSVGFHRGDPTQLSHGCIHVSGKNAATLWGWSAKGTPVIVQPKK
jgi:lipoprotein-anchoring transpeptidase ErfK/SrfK